MDFWKLFVRLVTLPGFILPVYFKTEHSPTSEFSSGSNSLSSEENTHVVWATLDYEQPFYFPLDYDGSAEENRKSRRTENGAEKRGKRERALNIPLSLSLFSWFLITSFRARVSPFFSAVRRIKEEEQ